MEEQTYRIEQCDSKVQWDEFVLEHGGHPLQLWGWGALKALFRWRIERIFIIENDRTIGAAQILIRRVPKPFRYWLYVPRGPVVVDPAKTEVIYEQLAAYVKQDHTGVALRIEPDVGESPGNLIWRETQAPLLVSHSIMLDLARPEGVVLADMNKSTRQRIRTAGEQGVLVKKISRIQEVNKVIELYKQSAKKTAVKFHKDIYYKRLYDQLGEHSVIFGAYNGDNLVAFIWLLVSESVAFELISGSDQWGSDSGATALLRWEAIRRTKQWGVKTYDLNAEPATATKAYGDHPHAFPGSYDLPLSAFYRLWEKILASRYKRQK